MAEFSRNKGGERFDLHGIDLVHPVDQIPNGQGSVCTETSAHI